MTASELETTPPGRAWRALLALVGRLPQAALSRGVGRAADIPIPAALRPLVLGIFARSFGIDVSEAELPLQSYRSVNAFFVRRLRPGARQRPDDPTVLASPVDGVLGACGTVTSGRLLQAKGRFYSAADLLCSEEEARRYEGGLFLTLYLSPRHYHRIHAPTGHGVSAARHVPGALLPVNGPAVNGIENLFPRNERLICFMDGALGRVAVVAVGAYNVGRISARFDAAWGGGEGVSVANRRVPPSAERRYDPPVAVAQGDEIMAFHLGSTVVLMTEPGTLSLEPGRTPGSEVRLGDALARTRAP